MRFHSSILAAHGRPCPYCQKTMRVGTGRKNGKARSNQPDFPTRDHVIPKSVMPAQGTLIVCSQCNNDKGNKTLDRWHQNLCERGDPRAPIVKRLMKDNAWRASPHLPGRKPLPTPGGSDGR